MDVLDLFDSIISRDDSYDRFVNHHKSVGKKLIDEQAGFENWLKQDEGWGNNPRKKENIETLFYCVNDNSECIGKTKKVKNERNMTNPFCDSCTHQMGSHSEHKLALDRKAVKEKNFHYE